MDATVDTIGPKAAHRARRPQPDSGRCPYCGAPTTRATLARIAEAERTRVAQLEQALAEKFARERRVGEATKVAQAQVQALQTNQEALIAQRVKAVREATEKRLAEIIAAEKTKASEQRIRLSEELADLRRRLERKTADELGSGAEADLYQTLLKEFGGTDKITHVRRGQYGADVVHDVCESGRVLGRIIYDSKAHGKWQSRFVSKLKHDLVEHQADHCVLVSTAFPQGARQLHVEAGVVVAAPGRAIAVASLLRRQIVQCGLLRLSSEHRNTKRD
jgi:hypothetical protein